MSAASGGIYAVVLLVVTPQTMFGMLVSAQALVLSLFGGVGTFWGPVIGAAILVPLAETLNAELGNILPGIQGVVYGVAIIVIILAAPDGIYWKVRDRFVARRKAKGDEAVAPAAPPAHAVSATMTPVVAAPGVAGCEPRKLSDRPILKLDGVARAFGGLRAVDGVSLTVAEGSIHGVIGPNGAGKTTLFNIVNVSSAPTPAASPSPAPSL